jgi:hypothetical protein
MAVKALDVDEQKALEQLLGPSLLDIKADRLAKEGKVRSFDNRRKALVMDCSKVSSIVLLYVVNFNKIPCHSNKSLEVRSSGKLKTKTL